VPLAPHPSPLPQGEGAGNSASAAGVLWRGLWPLCQLLEKPLPVRGRGGGSGRQASTRVPCRFQTVASDPPPESSPTKGEEIRLGTGCRSITLPRATKIVTCDGVRPGARERLFNTPHLAPPQQGGERRRSARRGCACLRHRNSRAHRQTAAVGPDVFGAGDRVRSGISPSDQNVGPDRLDQIQWHVLIGRDDKVHERIERE